MKGLYISIHRFALHEMQQSTTVKQRPLASSIPQLCFRSQRRGGRRMQVILQSDLMLRNAAHYPLADFFSRA